MIPVLKFWVPGVPQPQGSKTRGRNGQLYESAAGLPAWRAAVVMYARRETGPGWKSLPGGVRVDIVFTFTRPAMHYGHGREASKRLRPDAPAYHMVKPDRDKLERAILDALKTARIYRDDAQACEGETIKRYGPEPGALITIYDLEGD